MAYTRLTDLYIDIVEGKTDMTAISSWKKKLKDVKGLTKQQIQMLSTLPTPVITSLINQVGMIVADMSEDITEAKYTNVHNKIKRIRNLSRKDADMISSIDPAVLGQVVKALAPMFEQTVNEGKRTDGATSFMFKNGPDSKKFLAYAKDFRKAERWTMNGLFFVDVYDVNKPVAIKLAKFHQQFWKEDVEVNEAKYTNIHNQIKGIKGLKRKESDFIASIDPDILGQVVKALAKQFPNMLENVNEGVSKYDVRNYRWPEIEFTASTYARDIPDMLHKKGFRTYDNWVDQRGEKVTFNTMKWKNEKEALDAFKKATGIDLKRIR